MTASAAGAAPIRPRLAVQLWAVREQLAADPDATLARLREIGFEGVETACYDPATDLTAFAARLAAHDLEVVAAHALLPDTPERLAHAAAQAEAFGTARVIYPGAREEPRAATADGLAQVADEYRAAAAAAERAGFTLGIHHHWWELQPLPDGRIPLEVLAEELPPPVFFELDGYWARLGGTEIEPVAAALAGRAPLAHVKDGPADDPDAPMTALGEGAADVAASLRASVDAEWWIAELSHCDGDMLAALQTSHDYLVSRRP